MGKLFYYVAALVVLATMVIFCHMVCDNKIFQILESNIEVLSRAEDSNYMYPNLSGKPVFCNVYVYVNLETGVTITTEEENPSLEGSMTWEKKVTDGLRDRCPKKGNGCNPYSCQQIPYPNP